MFIVRLLLVFALCAAAVSPLAAKYDVRVVPDDHIHFPETPVGSERTVTVRVRNDEEEAEHTARITGVRIESGPGEHFIIGTLPASVPARGGTATFTVTFRPLAPGKFEVEYYLEFTVTEDGEDETDHTSFHLTGRTPPGPPPRPRIEVFPQKVNFGTVATAALYTEVVIVSNTTGTAPAVFRGVEFGPNNTAFSLIEPAPPEDIPDGQQIRLRFGFQPTAEGDYETGAIIRTSGRDVPIRLVGRLGNGPSIPRANIEVFPQILDFGTVTTAGVFTGFITVSNTTGTANATIAGVQVSDPAFSVGWSGPIVVTAGTQVRLSVVFRPQAEVAYETAATVQTTDGEFSVWLQGVLDFPGPVDPAASISVPQITANVGADFALPFILESISPDAAALVASCRIVLRFNSTLMAPRAAGGGVDSIAGGMRTIALDGTIDSPVAGAPLFSVPMVAALGDAEATAIEILDVEWFDAAGAPVVVRTETANGRLVIGDIWRYGGARLVNSNAGPLAMEILPNPVLDRATFRMSYKAASTLVVYDVMGNVVLSLTDMLPAPGPNPVTLQADMAQLPAGTYYCRLSSGRFSLVRTMRIE